MAATVTPIHFSSSTSGRPIKVSATSSPGTLIHTAVSGSTSFDKIRLQAHNTSASSVVLTVQCGGTTSPDDSYVITIPAQSQTTTVIPDWRYNGAVEIRAFAATANVITISGAVDRYVP